MGRIQYGTIMLPLLADSLYVTSWTPLEATNRLQDKYFSVYFVLVLTSSLQTSMLVSTMRLIGVNELTLCLSLSQDVAPLVTAAHAR